jgi:hypothetical protein
LSSCGITSITDKLSLKSSSIALSCDSQLLKNLKFSGILELILFILSKTGSKSKFFDIIINGSKYSDFEEKKQIQENKETKKQEID